jgi:hypothetical protein
VVPSSSAIVNLPVLTRISYFMDSRVPPSFPPVLFPWTEILAFGVYSESVLSWAKVVPLLIAPAIVSAQAVDDVVFQLSVKRDPPVFHLGERIELELRFSTNAVEKYKIQTSSGSRFTPTVETYAVSPADGAVDPRANELMFGFGGSFLSGVAPLTEKPVSLHADLNEWFRFTRSGTYIVTASSPRVFLQDSDESPFSGNNRYVVRSMPLELTILAADAEWSGNQVREIASILDSDAKQEEKTQAARRLTYIDTEAAASEMARRYVTAQDSVGWRNELNRGLSQTSFITATLPILEASLNDSQESVRVDVIQLLARVVASQEFRGRFPPPPRDGERASQAVIDAASAYSKRINELVAVYTKQVTATLPRRSGRARASAIYAAWEPQEAYFRPDHDMPSADLTRLRDEIVASVNDLIPNQQQLLLGLYWPRLPNPSLLGFVRDVATGKIAGTPFLREEAFKRWCELAQPECEAQLIVEIRKPATDVQASTLLLLPVKDHPELDSLLAARLESNPAQASPLIARYGSPTLAPAVRKALAGSPGANYCPVKQNLFAYLLRVVPEEGSAVVARALQQRGSGDACYASMLESIARVNYTPALGQLAEKAVREDPDPASAGSAATVLSEFGPESAEQALWDRLASWSERWRDRAAELRAKPGVSDPYQRDRMLEYNLTNSIAHAKTWKISPADFGRLANLCVTASCRTMVENWQTSPGK